MKKKLKKALLFYLKTIDILRHGTGQTAWEKIKEVSPGPERMKIALESFRSESKTGAVTVLGLDSSDVSETPPILYDKHDKVLVEGPLYHAAYIPELNLLLFSEPWQWFLPRVCLEERLEEFEIAQKGLHLLLGDVFVLDKYRVFIVLSDFKPEGETVKMSEPRLREKGYIVLYNLRFKELVDLTMKQ